MRGITGIVLLSLAVTQACKTDFSKGEETTLIVRLANEPDMLNPARSNSQHATQIESLIMLPLAELDPVSYVLTPLLIEDMGTQEPIVQGPDSGGVRFHYRMRSEAVWEDGVPVTGHDYAFTIKMVLNPKIDVEQWRGFLTQITDVVVDPQDPKKFAVSVRESYMLSDVITCNFNIYPAHVYDAQGYLNDYAVHDLTYRQKADSLANADPRLQMFADSFMQARYGNEIVVGNGPYRFAGWETGQRITLERADNWWGDNIRDKPLLLHAYPDRIIYEIVPDENTAVTMMKDGRIDVISEISARTFTDLRNDSTFRNRLHFHTPSQVHYHALDLNNHHPILRDKAVRKALARLVDYEGIINNVMLGMARRTTSPINPDVDYYNHDIIPVPYDIETASALLSDAGWKDTNGNGTLDKVIDGKRTELHLSITVSQRPEGQTVALLLKEAAAKAGVQIDIVTLDNSAISPARRNRNYEILPIRMSAEVLLYDPYQTWHSASDAPGGNNTTGFRNAQADSLITLIRTTSDAAVRHDAYMKFQDVVAEEQPMIFLYVPLGRIIVSNRFEMQPSARRPGYFENLFVPVAG